MPKKKHKFIVYYVCLKICTNLDDLLGCLLLEYNSVLTQTLTQVMIYGSVLSRSTLHKGTHKLTDNSEKNSVTLKCSSWVLF